MITIIITLYESNNIMIMTRYNNKMAFQLTMR